MATRLIILQTLLFESDIKAMEIKTYSQVTEFDRKLGCEWCMQACDGRA